MIKTTEERYTAQYENQSEKRNRTYDGGYGRKHGRAAGAKAHRAAGFTMPELIVVLVIIAITMAIAIPSAVNYIRLSQFRKNEENAKTIYLAAESALTWYRSSGQWEDFKERIMSEGGLNQSFADTDERSGRIYAITLDKGAQSDDGTAAMDLVGGQLYDSDMFGSGAGAIEIDVDTGTVYSAFYGSNCDSLAYLEIDGGDEDGVLNMYDRDYDSRRERMLGYYSTEDVTNVVELTPVRLKVNKINLVNSETLSLNWSTNSRHNDLDVEFQISFYQEGDDDTEDKKLFTLTLDKSTLAAAGWSGESSGSASMATLALTSEDEDGNTTSEGEWTFPLTYADGEFSLVLDGMMSADVMAALEKASLTEDQRTGLLKSSSTSITRLSEIASALASPTDIYATVQAIPTYNNMGEDSYEYRETDPVTSNTANTLFADDTEYDDGTLEAGISAFRHLSNIRYYDEAKKANYTLEIKNLDWNSVNTGVYDYDETAAGSAKKIGWTSNETGKLCFPSIALLSEKQTLTASSDQKISNLYLGTDSVVDDETADKLGNTDEDGNTEYSEYVGLFCENEGTITGLTLANPLMEFYDTAASDSDASETSAAALAETEASEDEDESEDIEPAGNFAHIKGVGVLTGRNSGELTGISVTTKQTSDAVMTVCLGERESGDETLPAGVGCIAGVLAEAAEVDNEDAAVLTAVSDITLENITVSGTVWAKLPADGLEITDTDGDESKVGVSEGYAFGIGGLFGCASLDSTAAIRDCENHADVSGNLFTGGLAGYMLGSLDTSRIDANELENTADQLAQLSDCQNDGLILCTEGHEDSENLLEGRYFGGLVGYADKVMLNDVTSASGRAAGFAYSYAKKDELLKGQYVGGVLGFGSDCLLLSCSTQKGGYILGSDYVGGIAGGLTEDSTGASTISRIGGGIGVTTNAGYVIGNSYVGGIIGRNSGSNKLENCINNGVAAGYVAYIGGIAGYNGEGTEILDCASYISDYSGSLFKTIVNNWKATGSYAGGLTGYNNGTITFTEDSEKIIVKSVSGIVVGQDYVGGVIGFNDTKGKLDVSYTLVGGKIYAYGDCAGGCIGLNASEDFLEKDMTVKPVSVTGRYCVGGVIGANVVALAEDLTADGLCSDNALGSITGEAFTGGVIGYQRTYTATQLGLTDGGALLSWISADGNKEKLLPQLGSDNIPTAVTASDNSYTLTLTLAGNTKDSLEKASNNMTIYADIYVGGVIGSCESESKLVVKNCVNTGNILKNDESASASVVLYDYLTALGYTDAADSINEGDRTLAVDMAGGIIGVNLKEQTIDHCENTGSLTGFDCLGGIAGLNGGGIFNCTLSASFGSQNMDYVGGIAGLNLQTDTAEISYTDVNGIAQSYQPGTIASCATASGITVSGKSGVGGIVGYNLKNAVVRDNDNIANIYAAGDYAGGIAGRNEGAVIAGADESTVAHSVTGQSGKGIGGLVGYNEATGSLTVTAEDGSSVTAVGSSVTVIGKNQVGGIVGINEGSFGTDNAAAIVCEAKLVRATGDCAGGIAGSCAGVIQNAVNASTRVTADNGRAGGIVPVNTNKILNCTNKGNVSSSLGYAGGIAAVNEGTITGCFVTADAGASVTIQTGKALPLGAICAVNEAGAVVESSAPVQNVVLSGSGTVFAAVAGENNGTVRNTTITYMPAISAKSTSLTVGGAAGNNCEGGTVTGITAQESFTDFSGYRYLGGVVGNNYAGGTVTASTYGTTTGDASVIRDTSTAAGSCYGGVAGVNSGTVEGCTLYTVKIDINGVYTASASSSAVQKETTSSHVGGIVGKNETDAVITGCCLDSADSVILADSGMLGGVAGYNKGQILHSGDKTTAGIMANYTDDETYDIDKLCEDAKDAGITAEENYVTWQDDAQTEDLTYDTSQESVSEGKMQLQMSVKGNIGGVTAYNAPGGTLEYCASGDWFINNKSNEISVATGGVIGMNEAEGDMSFLINRAFVGRWLSATGKTGRVAGGVIGKQNNQTTENWTISECVNYGTVYCYRCNYAGGVLGQWTGTGGNVVNCRNYGNLQTTWSESYAGAAGGIVSQLYHVQEDHTYNIISCGNFGSIYCKQGKDCTSGQGANDSAGILGNVICYQASTQTQGQNFTIQVLDCDNGPGVEIYAPSVAAGMVCYISVDYNRTTSSLLASTQNVVLRIERCRDFAKTLEAEQDVAGIFGDRPGTVGAGNTTIKDCFSANYTDAKNDSFPIIGMRDSLAKRNALTKNASGNGVFNVDSAYRSFQTDVTLPDNQDDAITFTAPKYWETQFRANAERIYVMKNADGDRIAVLFDKNTITRVSGIATTITGIWQDGNLVRNSSGNGVGQILFTVPASGYTQADSLVEVTTKGNLFYTYVRERYRALEGIETDESNTQKMIAPKGLTQCEMADGRLAITIEPGINQDEREEGEACDPFKYEVQIVGADGSYTKTVGYIYDESGKLALPSDLPSGTLTVRVRAVSMYDDVEPSDWVEGTVTSGYVLPTPEIKAELVYYGGATVGSSNSNQNFRYRFSLTEESAKEYADSIYAGCAVQITYNGTTLTLYPNAEDETERVAYGEYVNNTPIAPVQVVAQGISTNNTTISSAKSSMEASLPTNYQPNLKITSGKTSHPDNITAIASVSVTGPTLEDLAITVTLDAANGHVYDYTPLYRAELCGTWTTADGKTLTDVVFASAEIRVASNATASATLTDLPDYLERAEDLYIRVWCSQPGAGSVYNYYAVEEGEETDAAVTVLEDILQDESGNEMEEVFSYYVSPLVNESGNYFQNYYTKISDILTFLPAPVLKDVDEEGNGPLLEPTYDADGNLQYTFYWDVGDAFESGRSYQVALTGIDASGNRVEIDTASAQITETTITVNGVEKKAYALTMDADEWKYTQVEISVTRVGTDNQIGLTSTGTYSVRMRLEAPGQPAVKQDNTDELNYTISWSAIGSGTETGETGCGSYEVLAIPADTSGNYDTKNAVSLGEVTVGSDTDGTYSLACNLEKYAGKKLQIYVVAKAETGSQQYVDSNEGITTTLSVSTRLDTPSVGFSESWTYETANAMTQSDFTASDANTQADYNTGLVVTVTAQDDDSIPPSDGSYLLRAYIFDSEANAQTAIDAAKNDFTTDLTQSDGYLAAYQSADGKSVEPVQMSQKDGTRKAYQCKLVGLDTAYAGKWIVFETRLSAGNGSASSQWVVNNALVRLPYVKIDDVNAQSATADNAVSAKSGTKENLLENTTATATQTTFTFNSLTHADAYYITLTEKTTDATGAATTVEHQFRILETQTTADDGTATTAATVQEWKVPSEETEARWVEVTRLDGETGTDTYTYQMSGYAQTVSTTYTKNGLYTSFEATLTTALKAVRNTDGGFTYTLTLPDAAQITDADGTTVCTDQKPTTQISFRADASANENTGEETAKSDAYVSSNTQTVDLTN